MKQHRKIETWLTDAHKHLRKPAVDGKDSPLFSLAWGLSRFEEQLEKDAEQVRSLVEVLRLARTSKSAGRGSFEEDVFRMLAGLVHENCLDLLEAGLPRIPTLETPAGMAAEFRPACQVVVELVHYALDCLTFTQPRDPLAGNRRRYALELLGKASCLFEMSEDVLTYVRQAIKRGRTPLVTGALIFCEYYYEARDWMVPDDIKALLLAYVKRAELQSHATAALHILVESGHIAGHEATDMLGDWKDAQWLKRPAQTTGESSGRTS